MSFLQTILEQVNEENNFKIQAMVSTFVTALKHHENILISYSTSIKQNKICKFVEFILSSLIPVTITVENKTIGFNATKNNRKSTKSSYNILITQNFDKISYEYKNYINISYLPEDFSNIDAPFFQTVESTELSSEEVFLHNDLITYIGKLILSIDCKPMLTSFINAKIKIRLIDAVKDLAWLNDRNFVIPDDIQLMLPILFSHRFLLPGKTSFKICLDFLHDYISTVQVPI